MIGSDQTTALEFARSSLRYPATLYLPLFLFKMWEANHTAADQFYAEALTAYAQAPMDQFLYLSSYPFAATREIGEMSATAYYQVPVGLAPNPSLERMFVLAVLSHARESIQNPDAAKSGSRFSDNSQVFMALSRLEPLIANSLPDLGPQLAEAKGNIASLLTQPEQQRTSDILTDPPKRSFDETIESGDKMADAAGREAVIAVAGLNAAGTESPERLEAAGLKNDDLELRKPIIDLVFFYQSQNV